LQLSRAEWDFGRCAECGLLYISPVPSAQDLHAIYVDSGQFDDPVYTVPERVALMVDYMDGCFRRVLRRSGRRSDEAVAVLEVGAGLAWMCKAAKSVHSGNLTVAQDISPEAVNKCPWVDHYIQDEIVSQDIERHAPYDVISLTHVIEHLVDPKGVIRRCKSLLRPGGVVFVTAPHRPIGWNDRTSDIAMWKEYSYNHVPAHIQYFSAQSMRRLAKSTGCVLDYWSGGHEEGQAFEAWLR